MINKLELYNLCLNKILAKEAEIKHLIAVTRESNNDSKSSMGDKYETSREMLQQEINMLEKQLQEVLNNAQIINRLKVMPSDKVNLGALVELDIGIFYISTGMGEIKINEILVMTISLNSPLAKAMLGKRAGEKFEFNYRTLTIKNIA